MGRRRGQPYSQDLRDRVLAAVGEPIRSVAARLAVSASYVSKVQSRLRLTGEAAAGPQHNHTRPRLEPFYDVLRARVAEQADATIAELRAWVLREHGVGGCRNFCVGGHTIGPEGRRDVWRSGAS